MKLHRTTGRPDWAGIAKRRYNIWQKLAAATKGVATPGNAVTFIGLALVLLGLAQVLRHHYWLGAALLAAGRLGDVLDGWLADRTATKSPLGELLDAAFDKIGTVLCVFVFFVAALAPRWILLALLLPHLIILFITFTAVRRGQRLHPSRAGKLSMALAWLSLVGFVAVKALPGSQSHGLLVVLSAATALSITVGMAAAAGYARKPS